MSITKIHYRDDNTWYIYETSKRHTDTEQITCNTCGGHKFKIFEEHDVDIGTSVYIRCTECNTKQYI